MDGGGYQETHMEKNSRASYVRTSQQFSTLSNCIFIFDQDFKLIDHINELIRH